MNHQLQIPIARKVRVPPRTTPETQAILPPPVKVTTTPPFALIISTMVRAKWPRQDTDRRRRRNIGNRPNTSMEKRVSENTWVVDSSRDASTVDAIKAEFVDIEAGRLFSY
jgi:hypothetical protein